MSTLKDRQSVRRIDPPMADPRALFGVDKNHDDQIIKQMVANEDAKRHVRNTSTDPVPPKHQIVGRVLDWKEKKDGSYWTRYKKIKFHILKRPDSIVRVGALDVKCIGRCELRLKEEDGDVLLWAGHLAGCKGAAGVYAAVRKEPDAIRITHEYWHAGTYYYDAEKDGARIFLGPKGEERLRIELLNKAYCGKLTEPEQIRYREIMGKEPLQSECVPKTHKDISSKEANEEAAAVNSISTYNAFGIEVETTVYPSGKKKWKIFGHTVTSVLRWLGYDAWTEEQAADLLRRLNVKDVSESTIRTQVNCGRKGDNKTFGPPATLDREQAACLNAVLELDPLKPKGKKCPSEKSDLLSPKRPSKSRSPKSTEATKKHGKSKTLTGSRKKSRR